MSVMHNTENKYNINQVNKRIKEMRKLRGYTQQKLADSLHVKRQAIINWERDEKNALPTLKKLVELCEILDCSIDYLLGSVDSPEIEPISKASYYSGIKPEIIRTAINNPDYLDCLNFFMHPDNCLDIFNSVTLNTWRRFLIDMSLDEINGELREAIIKYYDEYISTTPFESVNKETYKSFLKNRLPREKISSKAETTGSKICIKKCVTLLTYQNFFKDKEFNYSLFITYLVEHTFKPLSHNMMIEIQKNKLSHKFVELFIKYLES